ncbi:MAG: hypothetical protein CVV42_19530 [Candidatus Riflebacteria bacterium HGW-Riflebacteria-2]|jgi:hypothetical protein|nr:MAG: hypothetical protein CVV42_19530 [Candidatus Riflebacteria bacterium HGW-Riflebacteria-2]
MKENKPVDIAKKHREDVIDTLQLRHKERRVLYALLLIFLATVAYENSAFLYDSLIAASHPLPELGQRRKPQLKHDMIDRLARALVDVSEDFPQYWARFSQNQKLLADATKMLLEEGSAAAALANVEMVVASMKEFAEHPLIIPTKNIERLNTEISSLQRILKLKVDTATIAPKPLVFTKEAAASEDQRQRNLFEYCLR